MNTENVWEEHWKNNNFSAIITICKLKLIPVETGPVRCAVQMGIAEFKTRLLNQWKLFPVKMILWNW
jgi:short-subunit dehydrogenase involved in D-alanine esterification of teichoic acids